jgi:peptide/nickel transport system substrate-binding protein
MHRKRYLLLLSMSIGLLLSMVLAACGPTPTNTSSNTPKKGGTLTDGLFEEPDSLLPNASIETYADLVDATIWAPLVYGDNKGVLQAGLLTEVPSLSNGGISSDGKTYTLKLRPNLKWSDGQALTAADVVFTLQLWHNPDYGAKTNTTGLDHIDYTTLTAVDDTTVKFSTTDVFAPMLTTQLEDPLLAPMPKHVFGTMTPADILKSNENFQPSVVSGPFTIKERVKADHITVVRNPNYYQAGLPYLDSIVFKIIPDASTVLTALQGGEIDTSYFLDITKLDSYKALKNYTVVNVPGSYEELVFNLHNPILADLQVRKAITMAIDIDSIIKVAVKGQAERTCDEAIGTFAHNASATCYPFDPAAAKKLLDDDGWTVGSDGIRVKNGQKLSLRWGTTQNNGRRQQGQTIGQSNLKDIGIDITIQNYPADTWFGSTLPSGDFDIGEYASGGSLDPDNPTAWLCNQQPNINPNGFNVGYYCNPAVDKAIADEEGTPDQAARLKAFQTFQQIILTDVPAMYLYNFGTLSISRNNVHNYSPSPGGPSETWNVWQWWIG